MVRYASSTSNWRLALSLIDEMHKALEQWNSGTVNGVANLLNHINYITGSYWPCTPRGLWILVDLYFKYYEGGTLRNFKTSSPETANVGGSSRGGQRGVQHSVGSLRECRTARPGACNIFQKPNDKPPVQEWLVLYICK